MNKSKKSCFHRNEGTSANTISAAFAVTIVLASSMALGQHSITKGAIGNAEGFERRVALKKEMRRVGRDGFRPPSDLIKQVVPKTDRATHFDSDIKSDKYWKELRKSITKPRRLKPLKKKPKVPLVIISPRT